MNHGVERLFNSKTRIGKPEAEADQLRRPPRSPRLCVLVHRQSYLGSAFSGHATFGRRGTLNHFAGIKDLSRR